MIFWDSSAVVPLLLREPGTEEVEPVLRADPGMVVWWGTPTECLSALARREREDALLTPDADAARAVLDALQAAWHEILPTERVRGHAGRLLLRHPLTSAGAFQLAAALVWARERPDAHRFLTLDRRLGEAARREGFALVGG